MTVSSGTGPSRTSLGFRWCPRIPDGHHSITSATPEGTEACFLSILFQAQNGQGHLRKLPSPVFVGVISWLAALNIVESRMYVWGSLQLDSGVDAKSVVGSPLPLTSASVSCALVWHCFCIVATCAVLFSRADERTAPAKGIAAAPSRVKAHSPDRPSGGDR